MCKQCLRQRPHWWLFPLYSTRYAGLASQYGAREAPMRKATTTASIENNSSSSMQDVFKQAESQSQSNIQSDISRTAKESERACWTRAASIVHTGPKLTFPFASSLLVAALLHAVKVFVPVLSGEVFPPAIYAKEAIGTAGHIEAHLIYGCLFVGVCPGAAFQRHQRWEQPREPSNPRESYESGESHGQRSPRMIRMGAIWGWTGWQVMASLAVPPAQWHSFMI